MSKLAFASLGLLLIATAGCRGTTSKESPIVGIRNMYDQPRYDVQGESDFFPDHRTMRPLVEGVVSREEEVDPVVGQGRLEDQSGYVLDIPREVVTRGGGMAALARRGRDRYDVFCALCHDMTGSGEGMIKKRAQAAGVGAFAPPNFHQDRIRHMPDGQLFATIANGKSNMPPYAAQIPVDDRWAIVAYVRALQLAAPKMAGATAPPDTANAKRVDVPKPAAVASAAPAPSASPAPKKAANAKKDGGTP